MPQPPSVPPHAPSARCGPCFSCSPPASASPPLYASLAYRTSPIHLWDPGLCPIWTPPPADPHEPSADFSAVSQAPAESLLRLAALRPAPNANWRRTLPFASIDVACPAGAPPCPSARRDQLSCARFYHATPL